uniref:Pancreatic trypsin inhibitor n=1 Tax=Rhipicephalus zambeziensis TaxID=60191 RepID=A0A224YBT5_9ACAR
MKLLLYAVLFFCVISLIRTEGDDEEGNEEGNENETANDTGADKDKPALKPVQKKGQEENEEEEEKQDTHKNGKKPATVTTTSTTSTPASETTAPPSIGGDGGQKKQPEEPSTPSSKSKGTRRLPPRCRQSISTGNCVPSGRYYRWYYNSETGTCTREHLGKCLFKMKNTGFMLCSECARICMRIRLTQKKQMQKICYAKS